MDDAEDGLLARCRNGDLEAFGALYECHADAVYRHAYHLLGDAEDAHDVRQDTFLRTFRSLPTFRGDCSLRTFLLRVCTNLCRDQIRSRKVRGEVSLDDERSIGTGAFAADGRESAFAQVETGALVHAALARLSPVHREVIVLRDIENFSVAETAVILGCSPASVPVKLFRARRLLETELKRLLR